MGERRSQHLVNRVQLVTETVGDEICLSKEGVSLHKGYRALKRLSDIILSAAGLLVNPYFEF